MKRHLLTVVLALVVGTLGFAVSGVALAGNGNGNGNGGKDPGGANPCPPSQHAVYDQNGNFVSCQDNGNPSGEPGGGIGNCGQNQSGNPGNGGDKGYGNGDGCTVTTTTPTETTPTDTTPTETTPTETTPTDTTPTETTPTETTPTESTPPSGSTPEQTTPEQPSEPSSSEDNSSTPSIVGQPPKEQHNPQVGSAHSQASPAHTAVAGTTAKSAPQPTRQPQPAPFTL